MDTTKEWLSQSRRQLSWRAQTAKCDHHLRVGIHLDSVARVEFNGPRSGRVQDPFARAPSGRARHSLAGAGESRVK